MYKDVNKKQIKIYLENIMQTNLKSVICQWFSPDHHFNEGEQLIAICLDGKFYPCVSCHCGEYHVHDNEYLRKSAILCVAKLDDLLMSTGFVYAEPKMKEMMDVKLKKQWLNEQEWVNDIEGIALPDLVALVDKNLIAGHMVKGWNAGSAHMEYRCIRTSVESSGHINTLRVIQEMLAQRLSS